MIDLRSDTVTLPTPAMREAIARAALGDDVYGEDPTVNRLQEMAASLTGKEAALLVASGTMANLIALIVHCPRGRKAILGSKAHTYVYEAGGASALGGIVMTPVANLETGTMDLVELEHELATPPDAHFAQPALLALENTHNNCGGVAVPASHMADAAAMARRHRVAVHLDGARIFNAAIALETDVATLAGYADSISFCLSKGLACPVGSLLCGSRDFIEQAHRARKLLGGGMRQAGIIAAAGVVALDAMIERLAEDHLNARALAEGLGLVAGINVQAASRRTNMVFFELDGEEAEAEKFHAALKERDVLVGRRGLNSFRAVTHYGIDRTAIDRAVSASAEAAGEAFAG
ncbi:MAG TPA: low-specificity L-threonine aldolase [Candidatus Binataceae bacterium]|nr:low-specificity L-threonine aldolase [Candidatus Binataceae bacterium]